jgi:hypothetical protein
MARKPPPSYEAMTLTPQKVQPLSSTTTPTDDSQSLRRGSSQHLKDVSAHLMLYLHHDAAKALQRYALEQSAPGRKVKVHDLLIEAVEDWFRNHGLREPVRAKVGRGGHQAREGDSLPTEYSS